MIKYSEEFAKKKFSADTMKEAYMKAVKWYATNVLAKDELHNVLVDFEKDKQYPTVTVHLSACLDEDELRQRHCQICRETHSSFFRTEETNCNWCKVNAYKKRTDEMIAGKVSYYKQLLRDYL